MKFNKQRLKEILTQKKVSQRELARRINVKQASVREWMHEGEPSLERSARFARSST